MAAVDAVFPAWDGLSSNPFRDSLDDNQSPDYRDWDQMVAEVLAHQDELPDSNREVNSLGEVLVADVFVSTAEMLALNATPKTIVAAPGSGVYLEFLGAYLFLDYNSAAYVVDAGDNIAFKYTDASGAKVSTDVETDGFLTLTADALRVARPVMTDPAALAIVVNAAIVMHMLTGEILTGNSPVKIRCYYRKIRKAALEAIAA
jgi:hypothetical protein